MKKMIIGVIAAAFLSTSAWAEDVLLKAGHPDEYTVKKGDTLWDISKTFLASPWKWPEVWHANPQIENPHLIYPGDVVKLIFVDGQPRLTSEHTVKLSPNGVGNSQADGEVNALSGSNSGVVGAEGATKLSPKIRTIHQSEAITAIPLDRVDSFLSRSRVVEVKELANAPYILAGPQQRIVVGAGDESYARGKFSPDLTNYGVFRKGEVFVDPKTKELLGLHAVGVGSVSIKSLDKKDVATLNVIRANEDIRVGDRLLPSEDRTTSSIFFPSAPDHDVNGTIVGVEGGVTQVGRYNVVMINRGDREGIKVGNVLAIYKKGEVVLDRVSGGNIALPDERAGLLMVFRTFKKMSFALVLEADRPLAVGDRLENP